MKKIRENPAQNVGLSPGVARRPGAGAGGQRSLDHQGPRAANGKRLFSCISNVFFGLVRSNSKICITHLAIII